MSVRGRATSSEGRRRRHLDRVSKALRDRKPASKSAHCETLRSGNKKVCAPIYIYTYIYPRMHIYSHISCRFGNMRQYWCMRFETVNKITKQLVKRGNKTNIAKTALTKLVRHTACSRLVGGDVSAIKQDVTAIPAQRYPHAAALPLTGASFVSSQIAIQLHGSIYPA